MPGVAQDGRPKVAIAPKQIEDCWRLIADQAREIAELRAVLKKIADTPAWGAPERWDTTPAEVRILARRAARDMPGHAD